MLEPMTVRVEVWPVAADEIGLWLVSGEDALRSDNVMADGDLHYEVEYLLGGLGITQTNALHSTSWRPQDTAVILTYMAAFEVRGYARDIWPDAMPIMPSLAESVGKPKTHGPTEPPVPRWIDVLFHGLRHLHYLMDTDATHAAALGETWRRYLEPFRPVLAGLYTDIHGSAA
jgi:hypothetical protein